MKKTFFLLTLLFLVLFTIHSKYIKRTKGFCLEKILSNHPPDTSWIISANQNLQEIFAQPFYYLGSGKECYAFVSQDQQYVVKFFKQKHMKKNDPLDLFMFIPKVRHSLLQKREKHALLRQKMFSSYLIAFQELSKESGLVYLHLSKTSSLKRKALFYDPKGKALLLDLDQMEFLIQRKAVPIFSALQLYHQQKEDRKAKIALKSIIQLVVSRWKKGICDQDMNCQRNFGLLNDRAIEIDVGEFTYLQGNQQDLEIEIETATNDLKEFLANLNEEWLIYLNQEIQTLLKKYHSEEL